MKNWKGKLRPEEYPDFVDWLMETATENTSEMLDQIDCPCLIAELFERFTIAEIEGFLKIAAPVAEIARHNLQNECAVHTSPSKRAMNTYNLAQMLSLSDHALFELKRRETEFSAEEKESDD